MKIIIFLVARLVEILQCLLVKIMRVCTHKPSAIILFDECWWRVTLALIFNNSLALPLSCHRFEAKLSSREIGKTIRFRASLVKNDFSPRKSVMTVSFGAQHSHRVKLFLFRAPEDISHSIANTLLFFFCSSFFIPLLKTVPNMTWQSLPSSTRTLSKRQTAPPPYPR